MSTRSRSTTTQEAPMPTRTKTAPEADNAPITEDDLHILPGDEETKVTLPSGRVITIAERKRLLRKLRAEFPTDQIEKLPKHVRSGDKNYGNCKQGSRDNVSIDGVYCGGRHALAVHLDYIGHAGITMRLNEVIGADDWDWEFLHVNLPDWAGKLAFAAIENGQPDLARELITHYGEPVQRDGGLWIKLTVLGVTKLGFGDAQGKTGANATKEIIGDALRNATMRFGVGTYLWSKSEDAARRKTDEWLATHTEENQEAWTNQGSAKDQAQPRGRQTSLQGEVVKTEEEWAADYDRALAAGPDAMYSLRTIAKQAKAPETVLFAINKCLTDYEASQRPAPAEGTPPDQQG